MRGNVGHRSDWPVVQARHPGEHRLLMTPTTRSSRWKPDPLGAGRPRQHLVPDGEHVGLGRQAAESVSVCAAQTHRSVRTRTRLLSSAPSGTSVVVALAGRPGRPGSTHGHRRERLSRMSASLSEWIVVAATRAREAMGRATGAAMRRRCTMTVPFRTLAEIRWTRFIASTSGAAEACSGRYSVEAQQFHRCRNASVLSVIGVVKQLLGTTHRIGSCQGG